MFVACAVERVCCRRRLHSLILYCFDTDELAKEFFLPLPKSKEMSALARQQRVGMRSFVRDEATRTRQLPTTEQTRKNASWRSAVQKLDGNIGAPILLAEFAFDVSGEPPHRYRSIVLICHVKVQSAKPSKILRQCARRPGEKDSKSSQEFLWGFDIALKMESFRYLYSMISQNYEENPPLGRLGFVTFLFASK